MRTALIIAGILVGLLAIFLLVILFQKLVLRQMRGPLSARIRERYPDEGAVLISDLDANSFGLESWGKWQSRGNGALVLTRDELRFFQFLPKRDIVIPLRHVTEVSFTHSHLGKATPYRLLHVRFEAEGRPDSIAVLVRDPDDFRDRLERARKS